MSSNYGQNMDVNQYIQSGILEEYAMGMLNAEEQAFVIQMSMLYPEVKKELTAIELSIENLAEINAINPGSEVKQKIFNSLGFPDSATVLPSLDKFSDHNYWLDNLKYLIPVEPDQDFTCEVVQQNNNITQMLVITKNDVSEETHNDLLESFLILKGKCECKVGNKQFMLGPGDFLEIPLHTEHTIKVLSPYVIAILQHQNI